MPSILFDTLFISEYFVLLMFEFGSSVVVVAAVFGTMDMLLEWAGLCVCRGRGKENFCGRGEGNGGVWNARTRTQIGHTPLKCENVVVEEMLAKVNFEILAATTTQRRGPEGRKGHRHRFHI